MKEIWLMLINSYPFLEPTRTEKVNDGKVSCSQR